MANMLVLNLWNMVVVEVPYSSGQLLSALKFLQSGNIHRLLRAIDHSSSPKTAVSDTIAGVFPQLLYNTW